ncbi:Membrane-bound transcription factor site-2 protease [Lobosporangium transversale]|uniref:Endopeptidase S2P n=1 Tax=Lobosporangium transversale TaxID=64571 RepID=A0A1Y2G7P8_9FUNG|nr:hypothetical protein BCR41DRAFT_342517 [Lobosporangium transversale]KAF9917405.1 Membrane-bound transcription factor site-2 protease [Lobosporangium transversale]ORZ01821.1 hypothetical protein BCR41DRAFT_342517 [Lobosporangium transversale]|eukprot:XP_021876118.1 hypothetical protein BCR41DRAFT_342517 [Lobosporangium transversale]
MGASQLLAPFLLTWVCIHTFLFLLQRFLNRPNLPTGPGNGPDYELLPTSTASAVSVGNVSPINSLSKSIVSSSSNSALLVKPFHVRFSTTGLNSFFFRLGNAPSLTRFWRIWYGMGIVFAMLAMVAGWVLLMYAAIKLILLATSFLWTIWSVESPSSFTVRASEPDPGKYHSDTGATSGGLSYHLRKRDFNDGSGSLSDAPSQSSAAVSNSGENGMVFVPVIPGLTLPLSHLPYYLIALLVSGIVHEAGHAVAAAREKTQVSSAGIFLYILYPGAFVDISSRALAIMSPLQQLRVICAGVWHNAVLFVIAWIFLSSGALQLSFRLIGWKQMDDGLSVVDIAPESPLYNVLKPGSVITRVDDTLLKGNPLDVWSDVLLPSQASPSLHSQPSKLVSGFCVPNTLLFVKPSDCCLFAPDMQFGHSKDRSLSCFTPIDPLHPPNPISSQGTNDRVLAKNGQCLPSFEILADPNRARCTPQEPTCGEGSSCYRPFVAYEPISIIRLYLIAQSSVGASTSTGITESVSGLSGLVPAEQIVLYQGDPKDIWETVQVTAMRSRWLFLPLWLPNAILLTIQYTMSFSLALSVLNIVPARHLDGHHALKAFVALAYSLWQTYRFSQSMRSTIAECSTDSGHAAAIGLSNSSTTGLPKGSKIVKGIVASTTVLLGWVMIGSLIQMAATIL